MKTKQLEREYTRLMGLLGERCGRILTPVEADAMLQHLRVCVAAGMAGLPTPRVGPELASVAAKLDADAEASALIDQICTVADKLQKRSMA